MQQQLHRLQGLYDLRQREPIKNPQQLIRSGDELFNAGEFRKALPIYQEVIKILKKKSPNDNKRLQAYYKYAACLQELFEKDALRFYKNNIIPYADPQSEIYNLSQANVYYLENQFNKALTIYKKIYKNYADIPEDPYSMIIYNYIARCLYKLKNYTEAQQYYKKIVQSRQKNYGKDAYYTNRVYRTIIKILLELEKYKEALPYIEKILITGENINWIFDYPEIREYLSPVFERTLELLEKKYGREDERVLNILEEYINNLFATGDQEKAMQVLDLYDHDKMLDRLTINQYTLPLFMTASERYFAEQDIDLLWSLAEKLDQGNFYKEAKKVWNMILQCRDATPRDISTASGMIESLDEQIANEIIQNVLHGNLPVSQLQKQQITRKNLLKFLSAKNIKELDKTQPKQKLIQIVKSFIQTDLVPSSKYAKIKLLGKGSFGSVWAVKDQKGNKYAMKEALEQKQNLVYESQLLKQVARRDPAPTNLKYIQRTNKDELIMQYLDGFVTLDDYMASNPDDCKDILLRLKAAVRQLHENGISHRDLKGINIMIHPHTKELRIIDFGVGCIKQSAKFPCQKFRGATPFYYPEREEMSNFQDWRKADQNALQIIQKTLCKALKK